MIKSLLKKFDYKKIFLLNLFLVLIIFLVFYFFQMKIMRNIQRNENRVYESIIGNLVEKYPEDEINIIKPILDFENQKLNLLGKEILDKYGYNEKINIFTNKIIEKESKIIILSIGGLFLILVLNFFVLIFLLRNKYLYEMDKINEVVINILDRKFFKVEESIKVGVIGTLKNNLNKLSKNLSLDLEKLEAEKESTKEMITNLTHQIKTPLAAINLYISLLEDEDLSRNEINDFLEENKIAIRKLENLFQALVNLSKLEKDIITLNLEKGNLKNTLISSVNSLYQKGKEKNIEIIFENIEDEVINHDKKWVEEALINIIDNAIKYSDSGKVIKISSSKGINFFRIDIEDQGLGIDLKEQNKIFKRFYRGNNVKNLNIEGSGVGLYLSRKIIEMHGGNIIVNKNKFNGSTFSLFLQNCKS